MSDPQHIPVPQLVERAYKGDRRAMQRLARMAHTLKGAELDAVRKGLVYKSTRMQIVKAVGRRVCGYVSTFEPPERHDYYGEVFAAGCYGEGLQDLRDHDERLIMHDEHYKVVGNFDVFEEDLEGEYNDQGITGLYVEGNIDHSTEGNDALARVQNGTYQRLSVGAWVLASHKLDGQDGRNLVLTQDGSRAVTVITKAYAFEGSLTAYPANRFAEIMALRTFIIGLHDRPGVAQAFKSAVFALDADNKPAPDAAPEEVRRSLAQLDRLHARQRVNYAALRAIASHGRLASFHKE